MGLRSVQVTDGAGEQERLDHVIGVDESGNPDGSGGPFVVVAVHCPRNYGEELAECLVEAGLSPWRNKSNSLSVSDEAKATQDQRIERFLGSIAPTPVTWCAAVGWETYHVRKRATIACTVASKTLTTPHNEQAPDFEGDAVLIPDGSVETYGSKQRYLRKTANAEFNPSFQSTFCMVYISALSKGDLIYPEITAADYIAGYVRKRLTEGETVGQLPSQVIWVKSDWSHEDVQPLPLYWLRTSGVEQTSDEQSRVIAWMEGRRPPKNDFCSERQFEQIIENRLESETLKQYLSEFVE